jgi:hypothetical protein
MVTESDGSAKVGYHHDVYMSFHREDLWLTFISRHFLPIFQHWLTAAMGRRVLIFFDEDLLETNDRWPSELAVNLATSRIMVCLWSTSYFRSPWCTAELGLMLARRKLVATEYASPSLIVAAVAHGLPPAQLSDIPQFDIREVTNPYMPRDSLSAQQLSLSIREFSENVAHAIGRVPEYDPGWLNIPPSGLAQASRSDHQEGDESGLRRPQ